MNNEGSNEKKAVILHNLTKNVRQTVLLPTDFSFEHLRLLLERPVRFKNKITNLFEQDTDQEIHTVEYEEVETVTIGEILRINGSFFITRDGIGQINIISRNLNQDSSTLKNPAQTMKKSLKKNNFNEQSSNQSIDQPNTTPRNTKQDIVTHENININKDVISKEKISYDQSSKDNIDRTMTVYPTLNESQYESDTTFDLNTNIFFVQFDLLPPTGIKQLDNSHCLILSPLNVFFVCLRNKKAQQMDNKITDGCTMGEKNFVFITNERILYSKSLCMCTENMDLGTISVDTHVLHLEELPPVPQRIIKSIKNKNGQIYILSTQTIHNFSLKSELSTFLDFNCIIPGDILIFDFHISSYLSVIAQNQHTIHIYFVDLTNKTVIDHISHIIAYKGHYFHNDTVFVYSQYECYRFKLGLADKTVYEQEIIGIGENKGKLFLVSGQDRHFL